MEHFSYSLFLSLLHSFWQAAILLCVYMGIGLFIKRSDPVHKRNILFFLLATQSLITVCTFFIYYTGSAIPYSTYITAGLSELFARQPYIETAAPWLISAYLLALLFKATRLMVNWQRFRVNVKTSWIKPSVNFKLFTIIKANEFGIKRKVKLWYSNAINTPLTFGFLKPVILLPVALVNNLSVEETETLIIHELTHIKNNDYFFNWMLIICETVFFFNPFIQVIAGKIKLEREKNCDTRVLQFNYPALDYAETLLKTARFKTAPTPFFLAAVFKNAQLIKRIQFFTEEKNLQFRKKNYSVFSIVPIAILFTLNIFLINFILDRNDPTGLPFTANAVPTGVNNEIIQDNFFTNTLPASKVDYKLPQNDKPLLNNKPINKLSEKLAKLSAEKAQLASQLEELAPVEVAVPVAMVQQEDNSKEIVLTEENSATGRSVTKVYKMTLEKGEWKSTLMWTITEKRSASDSLINMLKDSINNSIHIQSQ